MTLLDFLVKLAQDESYLDAFIAHPVDVMNDAGLNAEAKAAVTSRDSSKIRDAIADELHLEPEKDEVSIVFGAVIKK